MRKRLVLLLFALSITAAAAHTASAAITCGGRPSINCGGDIVCCHATGPCFCP